MSEFLNRVVLVNAFSLQMLEGDVTTTVRVIPCNLEVAREIWNSGFDDPETQMVCAIGHADTARIVGDLLECTLAPKRVSIKARSTDTLLVAQYIGPRLPEGATELPEGARIEFFEVRIERIEEL